MIQVALIGYGYWGKILQRYIESNPELALVRVYNSKMAGIPRSDGEVCWFGNRVESPEWWTQKAHFDAVVIATPIETHYALAKRALLMGKHVFCEKPLAITSEGAVELGTLARMNDLALVTDFTYTFSKAVLKAQELVEAGEIGKLLGYFCFWLKNGDRHGRTVQWTLLPHALSIADMFMPDALLHTSFSREQIGAQTREVVKLIGDILPITGQVWASFQGTTTTKQFILSGDAGCLCYNGVSQPSLFDLAGRTFETDEDNNLSHALNYFVDVIQKEAPDNIDRAYRVTRALENMK
jgi:predicted dehydrogenase